MLSNLSVLLYFYEVGLKDSEDAMLIICLLVMKSFTSWKAPFPVVLHPHHYEFSDTR